MISSSRQQGISCISSGKVIKSQNNRHHEASVPGSAQEAEGDFGTNTVRPLGIHSTSTGVVPIISPSTTTF